MVGYPIVKNCSLSAHLAPLSGDEIKLALKARAFQAYSLNASFVEDGRVTRAS
jgi:hypothetical protein